MSDVEAAKARVQAFLTSEGPIQIDQSGRFSITAGSTIVFVEVMEHANQKATLVRVMAPVLFDVALSTELMKWVAIKGADYYFGHMAIWPDEQEEKGLLVMTHTLLADFLDKDELMYAVFGIAGSADDLDDELQKQFGGKRYEDS